MGLAINHHVIRHFSEQNQRQLEGKIQLINNLLQQSPSNFQKNLDEALVGHENLSIQITLPDGKILYQTKNLSIDSNALNTKNNTPSKWVTWQNNSHSYQGIILNKDILWANKVQTVQIIAGIEITENFEFLHFFKQKLVLIGIAGTICLMFLGWLATWQGLRPVRSMANISKSINANNLSDRLELKNTPIELIPLATAFNEMLDRLEISVEKLSAFSSDLAHEIRTPINNLMMQTQVCLTKQRDITEYQEVLFSNLEEYERLAKMVSDILFLAKAEHGINLQNLKTTCLEHEVSKLFEFYDAFAAEKNIEMKQKGHATAKVDPAMISRAFSNLISNAIKYGRSDSELIIELNENNHESIIQVKNRIPQEIQKLTQTQLSRFFDRFYRLDSSRQRIEDGTGLGLAITKSIIEMHKAKINVFLEKDTIIFRIIFYK